jgi:hypothetical protein
MDSSKTSEEATAKIQGRDDDWSIGSKEGRIKDPRRGLRM